MLLITGDIRERLIGDGRAQQAVKGTVNENYNS